MNDIRVTENNIISTRDLIIAKEIIQYAATAFLMETYTAIAKNNGEPEYFDFNEVCMLIALEVFDLAKDDGVDTSGCESFLAIVMEVRNYVKDTISKTLLENF